MKKIQSQPENKPKRVLSKVISTLNTWQSRQATRRHLANMDARLLADAGITEAQRLEELRKPFWR